jgi:hypothetical protein
MRIPKIYVLLVMCFAFTSASGQTPTLGGDYTFTGNNTFTGSLLCKDFENIRCTDQFLGSHSEDQTNAAVLDLGTTPGFVIIPGNSSANSSCGTGCGLKKWNAPPNNVAIWDHRFTNDLGLDEGVLPYQHSHWYLGFHAGANDSYESNNNSGPVGLSINAFADAGGTSGVNSQADMVGLYVGSNRSILSNRPIWAANFGVVYQSGSGNSSASGLEIDANNSGASDDTQQIGAGLRIISGGGSTGKKAGVALMINNTTGAGGVDSWERGMTVANYSEVGMFVESTGTRTADLYVVPPADDTSPSIIIRNHANSANVFSVDDLGNVYVKGRLTKGAGSFKIDHPLDPSHKYLSHSFVESPDMMNIYNGNATTDKDGIAVIELPDYFAALNSDFRYQLTALGQFAQAIISEKIVNNHFAVRTDKPFVEVSWQVTGIRQDAYAKANRIVVEEDKTGEERGHYLHPELYGGPSESTASGPDTNDRSQKR